MPVWALIVIDILVTGAGLCVFALFHHVLPSRLEPEAPRRTAAVALATPAPTAVPGTAIPAAPTPSPTPGPTATPSPFTQGRTVSTDTEYKSEHVAATLSTVDDGRVIYYVTDIRISDIACFQSAFARGTYGRAIRERALDMAENNKAICALNGDYYGSDSKSGVVIRNGVLYRSNADADVLVLYKDGTMRTFTEDAFDADLEMANGAYQAWCFGPSLLDESGAAKDGFTGRIAGYNPRSAIGYYEPGHYCFVAVDGRSKDSKGLTLDQLAKLMESLGCKLAYNLDGGQSSALVFGDSLVNSPSNGGRLVTDILYIAEPAAG